MYVLKRHHDGAYVTQPGSKHSYTKDLRKARTFSSKAAADAEKCGNETAVQVDQELIAPH